MTWDLKPTV